MHLSPVYIPMLPITILVLLQCCCLYLAKAQMLYACKAGVSVQSSVYVSHRGVYPTSINNKQCHAWTHVSAAGSRSDASQADSLEMASTLKGQ